MLDKKTFELSQVVERLLDAPLEEGRGFDPRPKNYEEAAAALSTQLDGVVGTPMSDEEIREWYGGNMPVERARCYGARRR